MTVISLGRSLHRVRSNGDQVTRRVEAQRERTEKSLTAATIATSRYEKAVVELIRDRERLAEVGP